MALFKAYDVRGIVPDELNEPTCFRIGWGFARWLAEDRPDPVVVVGIDARPTGPGLAAAFMDGLSAGGATPEFIGPCTTPTLYWAVGGERRFSRIAPGQDHGRLVAGAMITASHNPARYNGVKFCREHAIPIALDTGLGEIEALSRQAPEPPAGWETVPAVPLYAPAGERGEDEAALPAFVHAGVFSGYYAHVRRFARRIPEGLKVAVDTANGMGGLYLPLLRSLGLTLRVIHGECDGTFPNHEANPSKPENLEPLAALVKREGCALGVAFDGDADRAVFIDEQGVPVGQDLITALLAREFLSREKGAAILYDLRSSRAVAEVVEAEGGRPLRERVGHSFMKATMRKVGCVFGGELAGHYYFRDNFYADSAILAVVEMLNALGVRGEKLSDLVKPLKRYAQSGEVNFRAADKDALFKKVAERFADGKSDQLDGLTVQYPEWWFNLRPSNTEPLVRLNVEAPSQEQLAEKFALLREILGDPAE